MAHFRKKPVVIEAVRVSEALDSAANSWKGLPLWLRQAYDKGEVLFEPHRVTIHTLEGNMVGEREDWIIRGVKQELYPCKPDVFEATYEQVIAEETASA